MRRALLPALLLVTPVVVGCHRETATDTPAVAPAGPVAVKTTTPKKLTLRWTLEQPGTVHAFETTPVVAKLPGYVSKVYVDIGDKVKGPTVDRAGKTSEPGTLLATVSIPELVEEGKQKAAMVDQVAAEVVQAKRAAEVAAEQVLSAEALAQEARAGLTRTDADVDRWASELKRITGLVGSKVIDSQTLDETRMQHRTALARREEVTAKIASAEAMVRESKAKKGRAEADVTATEARQRVAKADADRTAALLQYTEIRAPFAGTVTARQVHTGHLLQPNSGGRLDPLFVLSRLDTVRVMVDIPEAAAGQAKAGAKVTVRIPSQHNREVSATVTRTTGMLSPESRTLRVEVDLPNADESLAPGQFVSVKLPGEKADVLTLPANCLLFADETAYCFLLDDGKALKMRVRVGRTDPAGIEVLGRKRATQSTGDWVPFAESDTVIVGNLGSLGDGQPVTGEPR